MKFVVFLNIRVDEIGMDDGRIVDLYYEDRPKELILTTFASVREILSSGKEVILRSATVDERLQLQKPKKH